MINQVLLQICLLLCVQSSGNFWFYISVDPVGQPSCLTSPPNVERIKVNFKGVDFSILQHKQVRSELDITSNQYAKMEEVLKECNDIVLSSVDDKVKMEQEIEDTLGSMEDTLTASQWLRAGQLTKYLYLKRHGLQLFLDKCGKDAGLSLSLTLKEKSNEIDVLKELLEQTKERWERLVKNVSENASEEADQARLNKFQDPLFLDIALFYRSEKENMKLDILDADLIDLLTTRIQLENGPACIWESKIIRDTRKREMLDDVLEWCRIRNLKKSINELEMTNEQLEAIDEIRLQYQKKKPKIIGTDNPNSAELKRI